MIIRLLILFSSLTGCTDPKTSHNDSSDSNDTSGCDHSFVVTWENGGEGFFRSNCTSCHSSTSADRHNAPDYLNYDTLEDVREAEHAIRQAALWDEVMPPGLPLEDDDRAILESFLDCGL